MAKWYHLYKILDFWPFNVLFDVTIQSAKPNPHEHIETKFYWVMRIWIMAMTFGFAYGFWLMFFKNTVDENEKFKKLHHELQEKILNERESKGEGDAYHTPLSCETELRRRHVGKGQNENVRNNLLPL